MTHQGRADRRGPAGQKVEPKPRVVNPGGVDRLGQAFGSHTQTGDIAHPNLTPTYSSNRGYRAPAIRNTSNKSGSQGKY